MLNPLAGGNPFSLAQISAIGRTVFALQLPLRDFLLRILQDVRRFAPLHFHQTHGHDRRFLDDRKLLLPNELRDRLRLVRLDVEEEDVGLIVGVD